MRQCKKGWRCLCVPTVFEPEPRYISVEYESRPTPRLTTEDVTILRPSKLMASLDVLTVTAGCPYNMATTFTGPPQLAIFATGALDTREPRSGGGGTPVKLITRPCNPWEKNT